jgi:tyrosyl-tRNA synthetase
MAFASTILGELEYRGLIFQMTHDELDGYLANNRAVLYCGIDPSARSTHIGNLLQMMGLAFFRRHGHQPMALIGGATGLIGDPSGKSSERNLLTTEQVQSNVESMTDEVRRVLDRAMEMHPSSLKTDAELEPIPVVNNIDWIGSLSFVDFLRDVGKHFRVNQMMQKDSVKSRLEERESGLSFTEFSYMLLQSYDFRHLAQHHGCALQIGGSDQWGNITAGMDFIRRTTDHASFGLTLPLITTASGKKLGKSESGTIFLNPDLHSPYEFYQYWVSRDDADCEKLLKMFTFMEREEIGALVDIVERGENRGQVQEALAHEVTWLVHGKEAADGAVRASKMLFGEEISGLTDRDLANVFSDVPSTSLPTERLAKGVNAVELFAECFGRSRGEVRRLIGQGGGYVNNLRIDSIERTVSLDDLASESLVVLRMGKKKYHLLSAV